MGFSGRKTLAIFNGIKKTLVTPKLLIVTQPDDSSVFAFSLKFCTSTSNSKSFVVNYLVNNCGLSPEASLNASKHLDFQESGRPDSVLALLRDHGFSDAQISGMIERNPVFLRLKPEKIRSKVEFFLSKGASGSELVEIIAKDPCWLHRSLEKYIIPIYGLAKRVFRSDEITISFFKNSRYPCQFCYDRLEFNINLLLECGVPLSKIATFWSYWPRSIGKPSDAFKKAVDEVKELGFNVSRLTFVVALMAKTSHESAWERKVDIFKRWGWSEDMIFLAFSKYPWCMVTSEHKIASVMEFLVTNLGWESTQVAKYPYLFSLSLEKRILPRATVLHFIQSKGLIDKSVNYFCVFRSSERLFLQKYVHCFKEEAPQLLMLYEEKQNLPQK